MSAENHPIVVRVEELLRWCDTPAAQLQRTRNATNESITVLWLK